MTDQPSIRNGSIPMVAILLLVYLASPIAAAAQNQQDDPQVHFNAGWDHLNRGEYDAALQAFEKALPLYQAAGDPVGQGSTLHGMGIANQALGEWQAALDAYASSLPFMTELGETQVAASAHNAMAFIYMRLDDLEPARSHFLAALELLETMPGLHEEAEARMGLGMIDLAQDRPGSALLHFEAALPVWEALGKPDWVARTWRAMAEAITAIAAADQSRGRYDQALSGYERALDIYRNLEDQYQQAWVLNEIAVVLQIQARVPDAMQRLGGMLRLCEALEDLCCQAAAHNNLGESLFLIGRYQDALVEHQAARELGRRTDDCATSEIMVLHNMAKDCISLGQYQLAGGHLQAALDLAHKQAEQEQEASILISLASLHERQARYENALSALDKAMKMFQDLNHWEGQEATLNQIGVVYVSQGRLQEALRQYEDALGVATDNQDRVGQATALGNLGSAFEQLGQYAEALRYHQAALDFWQETGNLGGQGTVYNGIGAAYFGLGQYGDAETNYKAALRIREEIGDKPGKLVTLSNLGVLYARLNRPADALEQYDLARDLAQEIGNPSLQATALNNIGVAQAQFGQLDEALSSYQAALEIQAGIGDRRGEGASQANVAAVYAEQTQYEAALTSLSAALEIFRETRQTAEQVQVISSIGRVHEKQGDLAGAITFYQQAVHLAETMRQELKVEELSAAFAAGQAGLYGWLVGALVATGDATSAFHYAERARARAFLDQLGNQQVDFRQDAAPELAEQEQALRQQITGLQNALNAEHGKPFDQQNQELLEQLSAEVENAQSEHKELLTRLKLESPEYASLVSVSSLSLEEVQNQVLDEHTTLVEYFLLEDRTVAWVIDREGSELVILELSPDDLRSQVGFLRDLISSRDFDQEISAALYAALFAPLKPHIDHANLVLVPHGVLHYLPFAALWDAENERYLVEDYAVTYAPSASVLQYILDKRNADEGRLLAMGNPDGSLPYAAAEAEAVARLYKSTPLLGPEAAEGQVYAQAGQVDLLHLAAHGVYNPYNALYTRIELASDGSQDGNLEVHEVFGLDLRGANLVVLSACETALGEQSEGDELMGLTRAFVYAGTPAVIATQWSVDDSASGALMESFYGHLKEGLTNAEALRAAQLEVMAQQGWADPYYWAAFGLTGDYRGSGSVRLRAEASVEPTADAITAMPVSTQTGEAEPTPQGRGKGICGSAALLLGVTLVAGVLQLRMRGKWGV